jgi:hypothetical protein
MGLNIIVSIKKENFLDKSLGTGRVIAIGTSQ